MPPSPAGVVLFLASFHASVAADPFCAGFSVQIQQIRMVRFNSKS